MNKVVLTKTHTNLLNITLSSVFYDEDKLYTIIPSSKTWGSLSSPL